MTPEEIVALSVPETLQAAADAITIPGVPDDQPMVFRAAGAILSVDPLAYKVTQNPQIRIALVALLRHHAEISVGWTDTDEVFREEMAVARAILGGES